MHRPLRKYHRLDIFPVVLLLCVQLVQTFAHRLAGPLQGVIICFIFKVFWFGQDFRRVPGFFQAVRQRHDLLLPFCLLPKTDPVKDEAGADREDGEKDQVGLRKTSGGKEKERESRKEEVKKNFA